jgi:hypothetical protein
MNIWIIESAKFVALFGLLAAMILTAVGMGA